jgi:regulator of protease activity HflC (stomatin/prohibitin superfamily)
MPLLIIPAVIIFILMLSAIRIAQEYERGVIFRLGRLKGTKGPGLFFIIPVVDRVVKIDLRTITLDVPPQDIITRDNVPIKVNAVVYFAVINPVDAVIKVVNYFQATSQIAQTTLRNILGKSELDELLGQREKISHELQKVIDKQTDPWGIKVSVVEVKDVELPVNMQRAMAKQAEAERERRAKIIHSEGELQSSGKLAQAAKILSEHSGSLQLRYLQTLTEVAAEKNSTLIFPVPIEFLNILKSKIDKDEPAKEQSAEDR